MTDVNDRMSATLVGYLTNHSPLHYFPSVSDRWFGEGLGVRLCVGLYLTSTNTFSPFAIASVIILTSVSTQRVESST